MSPHRRRSSRRDSQTLDTMKARCDGESLDATAAPETRLAAGRRGKRRRVPSRLGKVKLTGDPWRTWISADAMQRGDNREAKENRNFDGMTAAPFQLARRTTPVAMTMAVEGQMFPAARVCGRDKKLISPGRRRDGQRSR